MSKLSSQPEGMLIVRSHPGVVRQAKLTVSQWRMVVQCLPGLGVTKSRSLQRTHYSPIQLRKWHPS